ncbi:MAG: phosphoribosylanthranilate isomerase [Selenomonadaceae bacterium]|nr:phosphoribosylanthranilate isomerase [Selenomonadaceae bacterium]
MTKVKICGIKTIEAAEAAVEHGAAFIGFIFFDRSRRYVEPNVAAEICRRVHGVKKVGVFVDEASDAVNVIADRVGLDYVQLHGRETSDYARAIERPIIKAWRFGDNFDVRSADEFPCDIILLDSYIKGMAGGTGQLFNWTAAARLTAGLSKPLMIAGGISIENVGTAIDMFRPFGVDVSGSLEIDGVKSVELIEKFMSAVRSIDGGD